MHFVLATSDLGTLALGLVLAGVFGGLIAGMLGVDSGIVIVPVLYHVLALIGVDESIRMQLALGTSLAAIVPVSLTRLLAPDTEGMIDRDVLHRWRAPMFGSALIGCACVGISGARTLALIFAGVALVVALYLAFGGEKRRVKDRLPDSAAGLALPAVVGSISAMMGMGGGTLGVPAMTLFGMPAPRAIATASVLGAGIAIPGTVAAVLLGWQAPGLPPCSFGYVNVLGFVLIAPVSLLMAPVGRALGHMTDRDRLRILFALFIALTTGQMLYDALA